MNKHQLVGELCAMFETDRLKEANELWQQETAKNPELARELHQTLQNLILESGERDKSAINMTPEITYLSRQAWRFDMLYELQPTSEHKQLRDDYLKKLRDTGCHNDGVFERAEKTDKQIEDGANRRNR